MVNEKNIEMKVLSPEVLVIAHSDDINVKMLMDWLVYLDVDAFRINTKEDVVTILDYNMQTKAMNLLIEHKERDYILNLSSLRVTYLRPGAINIKMKKIPTCFAQQQGVKDYFTVYRENLDDFLAYYLQQNSTFIGLWESGLVNKLMVLEEAKKTGFLIPETHLKTHLRDLAPDESYISKSLGVPFTCEYKQHNGHGYTERLQVEDTAHYFMTSFIQKEVKKKFEVRVYVFMEEVYSMAIFSQMNKKSEVDYRKYDDENPYLDEPFEIPSDLKEKSLALMKALKMNTGSLDFMYGDDGQFYFLEINPNGQFGYLGFVNGLDLFEIMAKKIKNLCK